MRRDNPELPKNNSGNEENSKIVDNSDYINEEPDFDEIYDDPNEVFDDEFDPQDLFDSCHMSGIFADMLRMPKPFGFFMPQEKMEIFLKERGYKIIKRSAGDGEEVSTAVKPGSTSIPEDGYSNIREIFDGEVQDILLKWLLKVGKDD